MVDLSLLLMAGHKAFGRPSGNIGFQGEDVLENDNVCDYVFQSTLCWQNLPSYCLLPLVWFNLFFSIGSSSSFLDSAEFHSLLRIIWDFIAKPQTILNLIVLKYAIDFEFQGSA